MVALKNYFFKVGSYSYDMHRMVFDVSTLGYIQRTQVNYQLVLVLFHLRIWFKGRRQILICGFCPCSGPVWNDIVFYGKVSQIIQPTKWVVREPDYGKAF